MAKYNITGNWVPNIREFRKFVEIVEGIDAERLSLGEAAGLKLNPVYELLKKYYTVPSQKDLLSFLKFNPAYQNIKAPPVIDYRYFTEDIPYGLVPISNLSRAFGLSTPVIDSVIQLGSTLLGKDFREIGLGLNELRPVGMLKGGH